VLAIGDFPGKSGYRAVAVGVGTTGGTIASTRCGPGPARAGPGPGRAGRMPGAGALSSSAAAGADQPAASLVQAGAHPGRGLRLEPRQLLPHPRPRRGCAPARGGQHGGAGGRVREHDLPGERCATGAKGSGCRAEAGGTGGGSRADPAAGQLTPGGALVARFRPHAPGIPSLRWYSRFWAPSQPRRDHRRRSRTRRSRELAGPRLATTGKSRSRTRTHRRIPGTWR